MVGRERSDTPEATCERQQQAQQRGAASRHGRLRCEGVFVVKARPLLRFAENAIPLWRRGGVWRSLRGRECTCLRAQRARTNSSHLKGLRLLTLIFARVEIPLAVHVDTLVVRHCGRFARGAVFDGDVTFAKVRTDAGERQLPGGSVESGSVLAALIDGKPLWITIARLIPGPGAITENRLTAVLGAALVDLDCILWRLHNTLCVLPAGACAPFTTGVSDATVLATHPLCVDKRNACRDRIGGGWQSLQRVDKQSQHGDRNVRCCRAP